MDIKDVNSVAVFQNLIGKSFAGAVAEQVMGSGFAGLIEQTTDAMLASTSVDAEKDVAVPSLSDKKTVKAEKPEISKKEKKAKKVDNVEREDAAPAKAKKEDVKKIEAEAPVAVAQDVARPVTKEAVSAAEGAVANGSEMPSVKQIRSIPEASPVNIDVALPQLNLEDVAPVAVLSGESVVVLGAQVDAASLAAEPLVNVVEGATGEVVQMSGAKLSGLIEQASQQGNLFVAKEIVADQVVQATPAEIVENAERHFGYELDVADALVKQEVVADGLLFEQAKVLDEKVGGDHKLNLRVSVDEENFSYTDASELVQDKMVLNELVEASVDVMEAGSKDYSVGEFSAQSSQANKPQLMSAQNSFAMAPTLMNVDSQASAEVAKSVVVETVTSVNSNHSGHVLGASIATENGASAATRTNNTSFRDVFKGMDKEVIEQVKVNITKSAVKGVDNIDIKLKPEELGNIEIKMQVSKDGKLQAHIIASRPETVEILQKEIQSLEKAFNDAGFEMEDGALSFSFREGGESNREQESDAGLRSFIGKALENESVEDVIGNDNQVWSSAQGLNIRV